MKKTDLSPELIKIMEAKGIDIDLTLSILDRHNREAQDPSSDRGGEDQSKEKASYSRLPETGDPSLMDLTAPDEGRRLTLSEEQWAIFWEKYGHALTPELKDKDYPRDSRGQRVLSARDIQALGKELLSLYAYGVLNGGSATTYSDEKKNRAFHPSFFDSAQSVFHELADLSRGKPKGITPAYVNPDQSPGFSFLELKMRALYALSPQEKIPFFQMSSTFTEKPLQEAYQEYPRSPLLAPFFSPRESEVPVLNARQPLIAAYTHSREGLPKGIFTEAEGKANNPLALPGGHGQSFMILKSLFHDLRKQGKRFVSLGNVDNLGYLPHPEELALLALTGRPAGFEFSWKTPVDVKGGILVYDTKDHLNCVDIGPGISEEEVAQAEKEGRPILFNCASGLFSLDYLEENIDEIIDSLPLRFTDRDRATGAYSQAEQITWEVIGLLEEPLIFAVNKFDRFLAAKMLMETLLTSAQPPAPEDLAALSAKLHGGLEGILSGPCRMTLKEGRWQAP